MQCSGSHASQELQGGQFMGITHTVSNDSRQTGQLPRAEGGGLSSAYAHRGPPDDVCTAGSLSYGCALSSLHELLKAIPKMGLLGRNLRAVTLVSTLPRWWTLIILRLPKPTKCTPRVKPSVNHGPWVVKGKWRVVGRDRGSPLVGEDLHACR